MSDDIKTKKEIVGELLLTEEDTMKKLQSLIEKTKSFVRIDQKANKIVISSEFDFIIIEKILLFLIGKYFSKELGLSETDGMLLKELQKESGIVRSTLTKPLGQLSDSGYIGQDEKKRYFIRHYKIEEVVNSLHNKYIEKNSDAKGIRLKSKTKNKKRGSSKNG